MVGVVVCDLNGYIVVVMLMGGIMNKQLGCVGDLLIIGVGCYVDDVICVVLLMGIGEMFMWFVMVYDVVVQIVYCGVLFVDVVYDVVMNKLLCFVGCGGIIVVDVQGNVVMLFNIEGMYCGYVCVGEVLVVGIYCDDVV